MYFALAALVFVLALVTLVSFVPAAIIYVRAVHERRTTRAGRSAIEEAIDDALESPLEQAFWAAVTFPVFFARAPRKAFRMLLGPW